MLLWQKAKVLTQENAMQLQLTTTTPAAPSFEPEHIFLIDLITHQLLPYTTTVSHQMTKFLETTPLQNTIRSVFLQHLAEREQRYNEQHSRVLAQLDSSVSLRTRHDKEQDLWHKEYTELYGMRYVGPIQLIQETDFTPHRWFEVLCSGYDLDEHSKTEARSLIFSQQFNQELILYGLDHCDNPRLDRPFKEFSKNALLHIQITSRQVLDQYQIPGSLEGCEEALKKIPLEKRKILLMNSYAEAYLAIQRLISGSLEMLKEEVKKHPDYKPDLQLSARVSFGLPAAISAQENEFARQARAIQAVIEQHGLPQKAVLDTDTIFHFAPEKFSSSAANLKSFCTQFYKECYGFYRSFSDFVTLLQVHKEQDMDEYRTSFASPALGSSPRPRGASLLAQRSSGSNLVVSRSLSGEFSLAQRYEPLLGIFAEVRKIYRKIIEYCPKHIKDAYDAQPGIKKNYQYFSSRRAL